MKYQRIASLALTALSASTSVSAFPLKPEDNGSCPPGYSLSVYYVTVTAKASSVVEPTSTVTSPSTSVVTSTTTPTSTSTSTLSSTSVDLSTAGAIETIPAELIEESTSSTVPVAVETTPTTQVAVVQPTTTSIEPTTTSVSTSTTTEEPATTASTSTASSSTSETSASESQSAVTTGKATFYGGNVSGGTCSFTDYTIPSHLSGVAFSGEAWDDAAECGACVSVTGPEGNSIKAMIVDKCPECAFNHLDLFQTAFASLSDISAGIIPISYSFVDCAISSPIVLKNKEGTSAYWFSMQVVNANEAVKSLEVSADGGSTWQETTRSDYNFFENQSGFGTDSVHVRVTGVSGGVVVVKDVGVESGSSVTAGSNLD